MVALSEYEQMLSGIIEDYSEGLSEYNLLELLSEKENTEVLYKDDLDLFKTHFFLFHSLYTLQQKLYANKIGCLEVDALKIAINPYQETEQDALSVSDPLRDYYLDINNLETTTEEDVEDLLTSFWEKYLANDHRQEALDALGLKDPVDRETIRKQYKQLAMEHHPDRGGDKERLQAINAAMKMLAKC